MMTYCPSAYLVVAAVDDKASFDQAERILSYLRYNPATTGVFSNIVPPRCVRHTGGH